MQQQIPILYEDKHVLVCEKPAGIPTQSKEVQQQDVVSILKNHLQQEGAAEEPYLALIHRLDQPVRGILIFAKTPYAARDLNQQLRDHKFKKEYLALVDGRMPEKSGRLEDYLDKEYLTNTARVCGKDAPGAKLARLSYQVLKEGQEDYELGQKYFRAALEEENAGPRQMLHIHLDTGRHHQIRVQLAHCGCPIVGDRKYNRAAEEGIPLCLCAYKLSFYHPSKHIHMRCLLGEDPKKGHVRSNSGHVN